MLNQNGIEEQVLELTAKLDVSAITELLGSMRGLLRQRGVEPACDQPRAPKPARMFFVPEGVRYLDSTQLAALTRAIDDWTAKARTPQIRLARQRLRLVYLMLRHSGAKVGEVLALDDTRDLDFETCEVIIRGTADGEPDRRVILPRPFMEELRRFLDLPEALTLRARLFKLDQGFVRRKISEQEGRVPFSRELLNPTVLRHSRAVELLRQGVPLPVVQHLLGHASMVLTSGYYAFSEDDSRHILNHYIQKEPPVRTSARNTFMGAVVSVREGELLTEVVIKTGGGKEIVSTITSQSARNLSVVKGRRLAAIVKAPFVLLAKEPGDGAMSTRNRFPARITQIREGDMTVEVTGELDDGTSVCALITSESIEKLGFKTGDTAWFFFKAMSVILVTV